MKKTILSLLVVLLLVAAVMAYNRKPQTPRGKTLIQSYWVQPAGKPRYIDRAITRVILDDGNIYERTDFSNKNVVHQFTQNGIFYEAGDTQDTAREGGDAGHIDARKAKNDCLRQGFKTETIAGYETFSAPKPQGELGSQIWFCPELEMSPLRFTHDSGDIQQGLETIAVIDGVDPKLIEARDQQSKKPKIK